jgi:hypothetical protein
MNFEEITYKYYSHWLGIDYTKMYAKGVFFQYNPERDTKPIGYSQIMDIYVFIKDDLIIVSYGNKAKEKIESLNNKIYKNMNCKLLKNLFELYYNKKVNHSIKYAYNSIIEFENNVTILDENHYEMYIEFFKKTNPNCIDCSWVKEYYLEIVSKKYCHGIVIDNKLVSATDAPDMPFMKENVQEIGINTLKEYRGRGYAEKVCLSLIKELLSKNICPMWSTAFDNIASDKLAKRIGFEKFADVLTISL